MLKSSFNSTFYFLFFVQNGAIHITRSKIFRGIKGQHPQKLSPEQSVIFSYCRINIPLFLNPFISSFFAQIAFSSGFSTIIRHLSLPAGKRCASIHFYLLISRCDGNLALPRHPTQNKRASDNLIPIFIGLFELFSYSLFIYFFLSSASDLGRD